MLRWQPRGYIPAVCVAAGVSMYEPAQWAVGVFVAGEGHAGGNERQAAAAAPRAGLTSWARITEAISRTNQPNLCAVRPG